ncbi:MAG: Gfo/Idh/MocA family oxidoreductase [Coriobacteriia bacterium]
MSDILRFGIIGYGKMGRIRHDALARIEGCEVAVVCERAPVEDIPEEALFTTDPMKVIADPMLDAIVVCTSNDVMRDFVVAGLDAGKHVFCEKPPGRDMTELGEMVAAEAAHPGAKLMFGFNHRHHESMIKAKELIESGEYGELLWMRGRYGKSVDEDFFSTWRAKREIAGGGILLDQGIHMLDLFLMMAGDFDTVQAHVSNLYWNLDIEDNVFAIYSNAKGQCASLHSTMTQWRHIFSLEVFLSRGYIAINGLKTSSNSYGDEVMSVAKNRSAPPAASWTDEEKLVYHVDTSWDREIGMFVDCIRTGAPVPVGNSEDARKVLRLVEATYEAGRMTKTVNA